MPAYPQVPSQPDLPEVEERVLAFWAEDDTFRASVENRPERGEFVFYDGPPFANGLPHYGHLLTGYVKDAVPRYQTMRGRRGCLPSWRLAWRLWALGGLQPFEGGGRYHAPPRG